jgi:hypothetical protein
VADVSAGILARFAEPAGGKRAGVSAFRGMLKFAPVDAAIFVVESGRTRAVSRLGDPAPGGGTIAHFGLWPAVGDARPETAVLAASIEERHPITTPAGRREQAHPDRRAATPCPEAIASPRSPLPGVSAWGPAAT